MAVVKRAFFVALSFVIAAVCTLPLFHPPSAEAGAVCEEYVCEWEDGTVTVETYASAYADLVDNSKYSVTLLREGLSGTIVLSAEFSSSLRTIRKGGLAQLLSLDNGQLTRLEQLLVWRLTRGYVWYSDGYFVWGENGFCEADSAQGRTFALLSGSVTASRLRNTGAEILELRPDAVLSADMLVGTAVEMIFAHAPYSYENGAVYLDTDTAKRLIAAVPALTSLTVAECDYADEGALRACSSLESLALPFAGNAPSGIGNSFHGELAYLFSDGKDYHVPASLKRVKITGGVLVSRAFYRCGSVEEIDLCGMLPEDIAADAFADCNRLRLLHTPNAEVSLGGVYSVRVAHCGCTVFERIG